MHCQVEVSGITPHGVWLLLGDRVVFLSFKDFPWFREAPVAAVLDVERPHPHHLHWPAPDVDLALESIDHPENYPLLSRDRPATRAREARPGPGARQAKPPKKRGARR